MTLSIVQQFLSNSHDSIYLWLSNNPTQLTKEFFEEGKSYTEELAQSGELKQALSILEKLFIAAEYQDDPLNIVLIWRGEANVHRLFEQYQESLQATENAVTILKEHGTSLDIAIARVSEVGMLGALGKFDEAISLAFWIRSQFKEHDFLLGLAAITFNLGTVYSMSWKLSEALVEHQEAVRLYSKLNQEQIVSMIYHDMGVCASKQGKFEQAKEYLNMAYPRFVSGQNLPMQIKTLFNLAELCLMDGRFDKGLEHLNIASQNLEKIPHSVDKGYVHLIRARIYSNLHNIEKSKQHLNEAILIFQTNEHQLEAAESLIELAHLKTNELIHDGLAEGLQLLEKAEILLQSTNYPFFNAWLKIEQSKILLGLNRHLEAGVYAKKAIEIFNHSGLSYRQAQAEVVLADCFPSRELSAKIYRNVLEKIGTIDHFLAVRCLLGLGRMALQEMAWKTAVSHFTEASKILDQIRTSLSTHSNQAGFLESKQDVAKGLLTAVSNQPSFKILLLDWVEKFKASALADMLAKQPQDHQITPELQHLTTERELLINKLDMHLNALRTNVQSVSISQRSAPVVAHDSYQIKTLSTLREKIRDYDDKIAQHHQPSQAWRSGQSITGQEIHRLLDDDTIGLAYFETNQGLCALTFTNQDGDVENHSLGTSSENIAQQWKQAKRQVARPKRPLKAVQARLSRLYDQLIAPIEHRLESKSRLLIFPHRSLFHIPFAGLYDASNNSYIIDKWTLQFSPSATILKWCQSRQIKTNNALLMGYPGEKHQSDYLPNVLKEVNELQSFFEQPTMLTESNATRQKLFEELSGKSLIHLAGHAIFNGQYPLESGLPLVNGRWLRASDLYLRHGMIDGATVILSGCETGLGHLSGTDVLGLNSAFLYAGASGIVSGLWKVDDEATAVLMNQLYQNLKDGLDTAVALQKAQQVLQHSERYAAPYYWAPFTLTGEKKTLKM